MNLIFPNQKNPQRKFNERLFNKKWKNSYCKSTIKRHTLFEKDVDYVVIDNKVKIVDEQTGRIMMEEDIPMDFITIG